MRVSRVSPEGQPDPVEAVSSLPQDESRVATELPLKACSDAAAQSASGLPPDRDHAFAEKIPRRGWLRHSV